MRIYKSFFRFEKCRKACKYRLYRLMRTYKEIVKNYILIYYKKHQIPHAGCDAVVGEIINAHELPSRLLTGIFLFLLSVHVSSLHS